MKFLSLFFLLEVNVGSLKSGALVRLFTYFGQANIVTGLDALGMDDLQ